MKNSEQFVRTELLIGKSAVQELAKKTAAIFGIGGVGSFIAESLARAGIANFILIDSDKVALSNINRQLIATHSTLEKYKVRVMKERILDINPNANVITHELFFTAQTAHLIDFLNVDYIADAIDTVSAKIVLAQIAEEKNIPIISVMGAGNKIHPELFEITDIYKTSVCPLARVMRTELKKRKIKSLTVVYSKEKPLVKNNRKNNEPPASISFVPSVAGLIASGEIIRNLINIKRQI